MRFSPLILALAIAACAAPGANVTTAALVAADASTSLAIGERLMLEHSTRAAAEGMDPVVSLTLRHADGRALAFQQANHAADHLRSQAPDGPLAQAMGLTGGETPTLYVATPEANSGAPFLCGSEGPALLGVAETADGEVQIVGLRQAFAFETLPDGTVSPLPYSPDLICARLRFRRA